MRNKLIYIILFSVICVSSSSAFDGERKGFVAGFGLGYAPDVNTNMNVIEEDISYDGFGGNIFIGYCWDNKNLFLWEGIAAINTSLVRSEDEGSLGISGLTWYHYYKPQARTFFSVVGIGQLVADAEKDYNLYKTTGLGFLVGGGYEFTKQLQFSVYFLGGKSSYRNIKSTNSMILTTISVVVY